LKDYCQAEVRAFQLTLVGVEGVAQGRGVVERQVELMGE